MSSPVQNLVAHRSHLPRGAGAIALWALASLIAVFFALLEEDSSALDGYWLPRGNDSFYHARRILDAAVGTRGFYQFDERLHAPDGAWIPWPWAYDYLLAKATQIATWISPALDPMAFISYVPVAWIFVNAALFLVAARAVGLSKEMQTLAMFCFAFSPLTQLLHWIGMIDHHFIEHTFVLLSVWLGLRWFGKPGGRPNAVALGVTLGIATAFHSGLFVLQLFPLTTAFLLWLRRSAPAASELHAFGLSLFSTTLLFLLPSEPFRRGMFEFGLHSWFHLYVAGCTSLALTLIGRLPATCKGVASFAAVCVGLAIPVAAQIASGAAFVSGTFSVLDKVIEVQSPYRMFTETSGPTETAGYYSWLLVLAPLLLAAYAYRMISHREPEQIYFAVVATLGIALLLSQFRLHYFGYFALVVGTLATVDQLRARRNLHRGLTFVLAFAVLAAAFQPALRQRLFVVYAPSSDPEYAAALPLFLELERECRRDPGVVLANSDDGNPILFHSECAVIANNFILRPEDEAHIQESRRLMMLSPAKIRAERPDIKYLLVRGRDFTIEQDGVPYLVMNIPIAKQLFIDVVPPPGFTQISGIRLSAEGEEQGPIYARLYKITK